MLSSFGFFLQLICSDIEEDDESQPDSGVGVSLPTSQPSSQSNDAETDLTDLSTGTKQRQSTEKVSVLFWNIAGLPI